MLMMLLKLGVGLEIVVMAEETLEVAPHAEIKVMKQFASITKLSKM